MLIADAQIHLWRNDAAPAHHRQRPYLAEDAIRDMDAAGVARAVNCPAIWDAGANDYAEEAATAHPGRFVTMGWFPLDCAPDPAFVEAFLARPGMIGLRFVVMRPQDAAALANGGLDWIWHVADRLAKPVALFTPKPLLPAVGLIARRFPQARFLIDHMDVGPLEKLPSAMDHFEALRALAAEPNIALKATGTPSMSNDAFPFADVSSWLERVVGAFGPDRVFWGTDYTRMAIPLADCVGMFTGHLGWLRGRDRERVMGAALCDWIGWER